MVADPQRSGRGRASNLILASKLRRPTVVTGAIERPRLLERLDRGVPRTATIIAAPAGYGKSVLASQWMERAALPSAWLSLEPGDGDLDLFLSYLTRAVRGVFPKALPQSDRLNRSRRRLPDNDLTTLLLNELDELPARMALVLDDYHLVSAEPVNRLLTTLLHHPPRGVHPVFLSRFDPLLPLTELRAQGELCEVRERDLRFTRTEIEELLAGELGTPVPHGLAAAIERRTEGWPVGLRLGLEARRNQGAPDALATNAAGPFDDEHIHRFLAAEVLTAQPAQLRWPLLAMSVLNRFCAPLCDALLADQAPGSDRSNGRDVVDWLTAHNLFVFRLGGEGEWYRYHHYFQSLLRTQLEREWGTDAVARLHRRAGAWLESTGSLDEALDHLLAAGDTAGAAQAIARHGNALLDEGSRSQLTRWIGMIPRASVDRDPALLTLEAWTKMGAASQAREVERAVEQVDALLDDGAGVTPEADAGAGETADALQGSQAVLRGCLAYAAGDARGALRLAGQGLQALPPELKRQGAFGTALRIVALQSTGEYPAALAAAEDASLDRSIRQGRLRPGEFGRGHAAWLEADLPAVRSAGLNLLAHGEHDGLPDLAAAGRYFLGIVHYERNDLAEAEAVLGPLVDTLTDTRSDYAVHGLAALALTQQALDRPEEAWATAESLTNHASERGDPVMLTHAHALQAELDLRQGRISRAARWVEWYRPEIRQYWSFYTPPLTAVAALRHTANAAATTRAAELLARQLRMCEGMHNRAVLIPLLGLRALATDAAGNREAALRDLGRAVSLSQPGGAVRLLADLGPELVPLLLRLKAEVEHLEHAGSILAAIAGKAVIGRSAASGEMRAGPPLAGAIGQDGLTARESRVLSLLALRYSNKEIAGELLISTATVKKHTVALYRKLHVAGRHEAVQKSFALGYLAAAPEQRQPPTDDR
ncbi:MAG TPA: LuxR C-terminal-related transcriptional regulator [Cryobacterium sp.]|nr:LuxR C-terminal-related transcriptional regulator [Cryobacterium sp.]